MKNITRFTILLATMLSIGAMGLQAKTLKMCADGRDWYPFTYKDKRTSKGMHIDLVSKALGDLGYTLQISPLPRNRCMKINAKNGTIDAVVSVSYEAELAENLEFPPDSEKSGESPWRIMQVDHMLVTHINGDYEYNGDKSTFPQPVRIPRGETLTGELVKLGLKVEEAKGDKNNFAKLIRDKKGSVVSTSIIAEGMNKNKKMEGQFLIQSTPITSKSYHLAFSKAAKISAEEKKKIWEAIAKWRDDYVYMLGVYAQY